MSYLQNKSVAEIAFNLALDRPLDYAVPESMRDDIDVGCRVLAPFRNALRPKEGYVVRLKATSEYPTLKALTELLPASQQIPPNLLKLADWISNYYCCAREQAIYALLPAPIRRGAKPHQCNYAILTEKGLTREEEYQALNEKKQRVIDFLTETGDISIKELTAITQTNDYTINWLCDNGWLKKEKRETAPENPIKATEIIIPDRPKVLNDDQRKAVMSINESIDNANGKIFLLHGVTGSGKTEVYLQTIQHCLEQGKQAIVLVPEIALTPQTCERFQARFGDKISILHSALTPAERMAAWIRINASQHDIVVGARSALFAPLRNLGLIVVDEEHENTYKQSDLSPRYHARDVAVVRGKMENATVILGSATPSLESYHNCQVEKYQLLELPHRIDGAHLPDVELVDMKEDFYEPGHASIFSNRLVSMMRECLEKHQQIMLFLNRRGYSTKLICSQCGYTAQCPNCSNAYTFHRHDNTLLCHLCGDRLKAPVKCPSCGNPEIRYSGFGTERIESIASQLFPKAVIARMDSDSMNSPESYAKVLKAFRANKIDILIGTQMIAKGLDFPRVTLVGIIQADIGMNSSDFRSCERIFQLITQVAGRAGRGVTPGHVIVQTYSPKHYALQAARNHDYAHFYDMEIPGREMLCFPPFGKMATITFRSEDEASAALTAEKFAELLKSDLSKEMQMIGPDPASLAKVNKYFRYQINLRGPSIRAIVACIRQRLNAFKYSSKVDIFVDVDPQTIL